MIGELGAASLGADSLSMPSIPSIPPLNLKSGADGNMGGSLASSRLLDKSGWSVNTGSGSAQTGISQKMIVLAAVGAGVLWLLTHKKS